MDLQAAHDLGQDDAVEPIRAGSLVSRTVRKLRELSLSRPDGGYLGAERDLMDLFQIGRPALRQAAKVLQHEQLLSVRQGASGGFYARRPNAQDVIQGPALYLRLHAATLHHMHAASRTLMPDASAAAACCTDQNLISRLRAFREEIVRKAEAPALEMIRSEKTFARLIGEMSFNPVFVLFLDIAYAFGELEHNIKLYEDRKDRIRSRALQISACDAILSGDPQIARSASAQRATYIYHLICARDPTAAAGAGSPALKGDC